MSHIDIIQRNAIQSWMQIDSKVEVILFGNDEGVSDVAAQYNIRNYSEISKNEFGTPLVNSVFDLAQNLAKNQILIYINSDIILLGDLITKIEGIYREFKDKKFLVVGRRIDMDIEDSLDFEKDDWGIKLLEDVNRRGNLHGYSGIDYFIFPRQFPHNLPPFAVGRVSWDNWLIYQTLSRKIPVIDATEMIWAIHQNHPPMYRLDKKDEESFRNVKMAGYSNLANISAADWLFTTKGFEKTPFKRRMSAKLSLLQPFKILISAKRRLQYFLGLG